MNKIIAVLRESRLARFLIPGGIILLVAGIIFFIVAQQSKDFVRTEATVTSSEIYEEAYRDSDGHMHEATYKVGLKYTAGGKEYENTLEGVSEFKTGDRMTIYYDPADPTRITQSNSPIVPLAMIAGGIAMLVGSIVSLANAVKRFNKMKAQEKEWTNG